MFLECYRCSVVTVSIECLSIIDRFVFNLYAMSFIFPYLFVCRCARFANF